MSFGDEAVGVREGFVKVEFWEGDAKIHSQRVAVADVPREGETVRLDRHEHLEKIERENDLDEYLGRLTTLTATAKEVGPVRGDRPTVKVLLEDTTEKFVFNTRERFAGDEEKMLEALKFILSIDHRG